MVRGLFWLWVHRGSGSKSLCVDRKVVVGSSLYQTSETEYASSEKNRSQAPELCRLRDSSHRRIQTMRYRPGILRALPTCIARTRACRMRIMRNLRRGDMRMPGLPCVHAKQCFVLSLRIPCVGACSVPASGLFVVSEIRDPGTRSSMTGARTLRRRCCRHHHASGHRSRRTIAVARASGHTPRECGVGLGVVSSAGCFVSVVVDKG